MAESKHDKLADALARLAGGDVAPSEHEPPAPVEPAEDAEPAMAPPPAKPVRAARPASARPAAPAPPAEAASPKPMPVAPKTTAQKRPVAPVAAPPKKQRPSAPTIRQVTIAPTDVEVDGGLSTGLSNEVENTEIVDDDDAVIVPAPEASVFMPRQKATTSAEVRAAIQSKKNLEYRRTLIPILLTSGTLMLAFGVLKFFTGADSMLQSIPNWIPIVLICGSLVLLALAGANMMSVKQQLVAEETKSV